MSGSTPRFSIDGSSRLLPVRQGPGGGEPARDDEGDCRGHLPDALIERRDKADFTGAQLGQHTRRFAETWSGGGVDTDLVDPECLRGMWRSEPDVRPALLLQLAWLHDHGAESGTPRGQPPPRNRW